MAIYALAPLLPYRQGIMDDNKTIGLGLITRTAPAGVGPTLDKLEVLLRAGGITVFARIDHAAGAKQVGLTMPPSQVLIFGNPRGGTALMLAAPTLAIDLPFKALAWEDAHGQAWLSFNDPRYLAQRFGLGEEHLRPLAPLVAIIERAIA